MILFTVFPVVFAGLAFHSHVHGIPLLERDYLERLRRGNTAFKSVKELFKFQNFKLYLAAVAAIIKPPFRPPKGGRPGEYRDGCGHLKPPFIPPKGETQREPWFIHHFKFPLFAFLSFFLPFGEAGWGFFLVPSPSGRVRVGLLS
jgi:hypothetical protein